MPGKETFTLSSETGTAGCDGASAIAPAGNPPMRRFAGSFGFEAAVVEEATFRLLATGGAPFGPLTTFVFAARPAGSFARAGGPTSTGFSTALTNVARPVRFLPEAAVTGIGSIFAGSAGLDSVGAIALVARIRERCTTLKTAFGFAGGVTGEATIATG